jgi:hypothetical protein
MKSASIAFALVLLISAARAGQGNVTAEFSGWTGAPEAWGTITDAALLQAYAYEDKDCTAAASPFSGPACDAIFQIEKILIARGYCHVFEPSRRGFPVRWEKGPARVWNHDGMKARCEPIPVSE